MQDVLITFSLLINEITTGEIISVTKKAYIKTIGELAQLDINILKSLVGVKLGEHLYNYANGIDESPVLECRERAKGYSNSITLEYDVQSMTEAENILLALVDVTAMRMRTDGAKAYCVGVTVRDSNFQDKAHPVITPVPFDFAYCGHALCIIDTRASHADLTDDYASVPAEMKAVAAHFGKAVLREVDESGFVAEIPALREKLGDRAILRALHFFAENKRVAAQKNALLSGDLDAFFSEVLASGKSSFCYLQNVYTAKNLSEQGLSLALCLAEQYLASRGGAWRVHGGGFAGTIQAYVSMDEVEGFRALMDGVFGEGKCIVLRIRPEGAVKIA